MRTIKQTAFIRNATPTQIYATLMDGKRHGALTGQPAKVSARVGGAWSVGRDLEGRHLRLAKDRRIVQTWRANNWPKGVYSRASFALAKARGGTRITFTQTGVPTEFFREISAGWRSYYWKPMRALWGAKARNSGRQSGERSSEAR